MKKPDGFMLYFDRLDPMRELSNEEKGAVFAAVWEYAEAGVIPELPPPLMPYWRLLRRNIDDGMVRYNETSVRNRYNRYKGEMKRRNQDSDEMWEWWAVQDDFTPELFTKEDWHDDAVNAHRKVNITTVDERQPPLTGVTNTNTNPTQAPTQHEPNTSTNTSTCTDTGDAGGNETNGYSPSETTGYAIEDDSPHEAYDNALRAYIDMRDEIGEPVDTMESMRTLERLQEETGYDPVKMTHILRQATKAKRPLTDAGEVIGKLAAACSL